MIRPRKAVFPVAGLGTRLLPASKAIPKELLPVLDRPVVQVAVEEAVAAGIEQIVFVNSSGKSAIEDHFDFSFALEANLTERRKDALLTDVQRVSSLCEIVSVRQKKPLGLGHAVLCARSVVGDEPFAVLLADDIIDAERPAIGEMIDAYTRTGRAQVALMEVPREQTSMYGVGKPSGPVDGRSLPLGDLVEKPKPADAPSNFAVIGRYVLPASIFPILERTQKGAGGEIQLTDALRVLAADGNMSGFFFEGTRYDAGERLGLVLANVAFAMKRPELREGLLRGLAESYGDALRPLVKGPRA